MYLTNKDRMENKIKTFSEFGKTDGGGITRLCFSDADIRARQEVIKRMEDIGAEIKIDDLGCIYATLKGSEDLPAIMSGSHTDSVVRGGNYDGILGVMSAMEVAETIVKENIPHRHPYTVVVWTNEEGSRFDPAMMVSGIHTGKFEEEKMMMSKDTEGITFKEALEKSGFKGKKENRVNWDNVRGLFELHIEQGPVLENEKKEIGVVQGVCGMINYEFTFKGFAAHAGTFPMKYREDAFLAAAQAKLWLHEKLDKLDSKLVYTTGRVICEPNIHTIVPEMVKFTLDARHQDPEVIKEVVEIIKSMPKEFAKCKASYEELWSRKTVNFAEENIQCVENSVKELGYSYMKLYSGPGHDAQYIADMVPTSMIFAPSKDGLSHTEVEYTSVEECWRAANVLLNAVLKLDAK